MPESTTSSAIPAASREGREAARARAQRLPPASGSTALVVAIRPAAMAAKCRPTLGNPGQCSEATGCGKNIAPRYSQKGYDRTARLPCNFPWKNIKPLKSFMLPLQIFEIRFLPCVLPCRREPVPPSSCTPARPLRAVEIPHIGHVSAKPIFKNPPCVSPCRREPVLLSTRALRWQRAKWLCIGYAALSPIRNSLPSGTSTGISYGFQKRNCHIIQ